MAAAVPSRREVIFYFISKINTHESANEIYTLFLMTPYGQRHSNTMKAQKGSGKLLFLDLFIFSFNIQSKYFLFVFQLFLAYTPGRRRCVGPK